MNQRKARLVLLTRLEEFRGRGGAAESGATFVPLEAEPREVGEDGLLGPPGGALEVGVLDAEHEAAAVGAREEVVEERGAGAADVEVARGRGREADADGVGGGGGGGGAGAGGEGPAEVDVAGEGAARRRVRAEAEAQPRRARQQRGRRHP